MEINKEADDEKIKEFIEEMSSELKTQQHKTAPEQLYIRFGEIPADERSKIYCGGYDVIGVEEGVSVYPAFKDINGNYAIGLTLPVTANALRTQQMLIEYDNRKCYLVKGNYVGKGSDGEPLIRDVEIITEITNYRQKKRKQLKLKVTTLWKKFFKK